MKNTLLLSTLLVFKGLSASADSMPSRQNNSQSGIALAAITALMERYDFMKGTTDFDPTTGGDIAIACLALNFQKWANAYLVPLANTNFDASAIQTKLSQFGAHIIDSKSVLHIVSAQRPGVVDAILQSESVYRTQPSARFPNGIPDLNPANVTFQEIFDTIYAQNLSMCVQINFVGLVSSKVPAADPNAAIDPNDVSNHTKIEWRATPAGGVAPIETNRTSLETNHESI